MKSFLKIYHTIIVTNKDDVIVANATVMREKIEYTFNGEYYTSYNFEVSLVPFNS